MFEYDTTGLDTEGKKTMLQSSSRRLCNSAAKETLDSIHSRHSSHIDPGKLEISVACDKLPGRSFPMIYVSV
jgi:hypothetical protein